MRRARTILIACLCGLLAPSLWGEAPATVPPILVDPPLLANSSTRPGVFEARIEVRTANCLINGVTMPLLTYNGTFPGPTIRVKRGDVVKLHLVNSLPATSEKNVLGFVRNHTNLCVHGLNVPCAAPADDVRLDIAPGASFDYQFDLCATSPGVTGFYHPGLRGLAAEQMSAGLVGAIVVEDDLPGYESHVLVLKDFTATGQTTLSFTSAQYSCPKEGETVTVNGQVNPAVIMRPGQVQRWRLINGSNARFYKLTLDGCQMHVVGADAGLLDKPFPVSRLLLAPGERADVLVKAGDTAGCVRLVAQPYTREEKSAAPGAQLTVLTVCCQGFPISDPIPATLGASARTVRPDVSLLARRSLTLSLTDARAQIKTAGSGTGPAVVTSDSGAGEVWEIFNDSPTDCPFHIQASAVQVLSITGGDAEYARFLTASGARKDVVIVPRRGSLRLLVPAGGWPGMAAFQSQILEYADLGMTGLWHRTAPVESQARPSRF